MVNREIAQALFVTEKTVETHLGKAYAKLKVKSRKQLPEALGDPSDRHTLSSGVQTSGGGRGVALTTGGRRGGRVAA